MFLKNPVAKVRRNNGPCNTKGYTAPFEVQTAISADEHDLTAIPTIHPGNLAFRPRLLHNCRICGNFVFKLRKE